MRDAVGTPLSLAAATLLRASFDGLQIMRRLL